VGKQRVGGTFTYSTIPSDPVSEALQNMLEMMQTVKHRITFVFRGMSWTPSPRPHVEFDHQPVSAINGSNVSSVVSDSLNDVRFYYQVQWQSEEHAPR
jgi:hypothetical protein